MKVMLCENADWLLSEEAFSIYASCMYHPTYKDYKGQMDDLLCDPSTKVFVYEDQGRKTGMIILKFSDAAAEIIGIAVSVDARRKGIGKQLIRRVMELDDLECVKAQTDDDTIGFYRKCGFSEEKIVIEYPDGPAVRYNCVLHKQTNSDLQRGLYEQNSDSSIIQPSKDPGEITGGTFNFNEDELNTAQEIHTANQLKYLNLSKDYYDMTKSDLDACDAMGNKNVSTPEKTTLNWEFTAPDGYEVKNYTLVFSQSMDLSDPYTVVGTKEPTISFYNSF